MTTHPKTFSEAIEDAGTLTKSVLLGNGFSIDYDEERFTYDSLVDAATLENLSVDKDEFFTRIESTSFEVGMHALQVAAWLVNEHGNPQSLADTLRIDAQIVKNGLIDALCTLHPRNSHQLDESEIQHSRQFLSNFDRVYTLNYDLLLYWVIMHDSVSPQIPKDDGFRQYDGSLCWKRTRNVKQEVFYLHGAMHLYAEDSEVRKLSFKANGPLIDAVTQRLEDGNYPLIVTEGPSEAKVTQIEDDPYLSAARESFAGVKEALFVHGSSLAENDAHIWDSIARNNGIEVLYVGVSKRPTGRFEKALMDRAMQIKKQREAAGGESLDVVFYDSATANIWR